MVSAGRSLSEGAASPNRYVRIGVDVGGTFTHAVAINGKTLSVIGKIKVPTTHTASEGVARGVVESLLKLLKDFSIAPDSVSFIAHSTTQATNALLEGDVAKVGIIGMGSGSSKHPARLATKIGNVELSPGKYISTSHRFLDTSIPPSPSNVEKALDELCAEGCTVIAASEAFSVDEPDNERTVVDLAAQRGVSATCGSEVTSLYGLKIRTRTAVINASMLPKMIESADMTEKGVREAGIKAPIMIMRSDGGVMDIESMRKRPIFTMLSGPAAGLAAAIMYLQISDGIFMEVGGTSTDISAIKNGKALIKSAELGGKKLYARTLDVRTVGVAGGSIPRLQGNKIVAMGPRSAHIAGLGYASFSNPLDNPQIQLISPCKGDPADYIAISSDDNAPSLCLTTTCAANFLGQIAPNDCAAGNLDSIASALGALGKKTGISERALAVSMLETASFKCIPIIKRLIAEYRLAPELLTLIGGGGGAASMVPFIGSALSMKHQLAENADVVSAIGVALALLRETVERQAINPTNDDLFRVREEAYVAVQRMGADPASIEVTVEIDSRNKTVRATATGATASARAGSANKARTSDELSRLAAEALRAIPDLAAQTNHYYVFTAQTCARKLAGLISHKQRSLCVIDRTGVVRLQIKDGKAKTATCSCAEAAINDLAEDLSEYGGAGRLLPNIVVLAGVRIIDLSGLLDLSQVTSLARVELAGLPPDLQICVLASKN